jgi:predicted Zn-dependent protease
MKRLLAALTAVLVLAGTTVQAANERELGRRFLLQARSALPLVDDPAVVGVVRRIGNRLVKALGPQEFDYQFFVVRAPSINAFAVPGGYVFVFSGLLARAETEDELAGVLAHEIGHVHAHHVEREQAAGQVWTAAGLLGILLAAVNPVLGVGAMAAAQTAQLKFSREFEQEADFLGLRIAADAGFDPHSLGGFFGHLLAESRLNPTGVPPYMLTHPVAEDRVSAIDSIIQSQKLPTPPGRPADSLDLREAQAVVRALDEPSDVVIGEYRKRVKTEGSDEAHYLLGRVYQTIGKLEAAKTELESVSGNAALADRADGPLGSLYLTMSDHESAKQHLERRVSRHPKDAWARRQLGRALEEEGDAAAAAAQYRQAVALAPDDAEAQRLLGLGLGRGGEEREGLYHLALASELSGDLPQALRHFERVKDLTPKTDPRRAEVDAAIDDLRAVVPHGERESAERLPSRGASPTSWSPAGSGWP